MTTTQERTNNNQYFMQVLNYYEQDLALNRSGQLSPSQRELLQLIDKRKRSSVIYGLAVTLIVLIIGAGLVLVRPEFRGWIESVLKMDIGRIGLAIPVFAFGITLIWMVWLLIRRPWSQQNLIVRTIEGPARIRELTFPPNSTANLIAQYTTGDVASFRVKIGNQVFFTAPLVGRGFVKDQVYRVHYTQLGRGARGRWLLSAERL